MARRVIVRYLLVIGVLGIVVIPFLWIVLFGRMGLIDNLWSLIK